MPDETTKAALLEELATRRGFLRRMGGVAAPGLGALVIPSTASATVTGKDGTAVPLQKFSCCRSTSCPRCPSGSYRYLCTGCGTSCCICYSHDVECFTGECPIC
jgi:hypothetical protein